MGIITQALMSALRMGSQPASDSLGELSHEQSSQSFPQKARDIIELSAALREAGSNRCHTMASSFYPPKTQRELLEILPLHDRPGVKEVRVWTAVFQRPFSRNQTGGVDFPPLSEQRINLSLESDLVSYGVELTAQGEILSAKGRWNMVKLGSDARLPPAIVVALMNLVVPEIKESLQRCRAFASAVPTAQMAERSTH